MQWIWSWHMGATDVHKYMKKYKKLPDFLKQSTKRYLPMSWLKMTLQEEPSDLLSAHHVHPRVFWLGFSKGLSVGWTPLSNLLTGIPSDSLGPELNQNFWRSPWCDPVLRCPFADESLLQGLFIGGCREKLAKKTETVHIVGKRNGVTINILQMKVMKFFLGKLWRSFTVSHNSWVNLSFATCFPGWLTSSIFPTLPVVLGCLLFPYWGVMEMCVCPLVLLVWSEEGKPSYQNPSGTVKEQKTPVQVRDLQPKLSRTTVKSIYQSSWLSP